MSRAPTLRIALLAYRGKPHSGGQGVYVRHLSRSLRALGHHVEVIGGPPYPELDPGTPLTRLDSLDLYRDPDPFRVPHPREFRDLIDIAEFAIMGTAGFPEPLTFSVRAYRELRARVGDFDVVLDNQCLGYGLLAIERLGLPVAATIHHPISVDRRLELAAAPTLRRRLTLRRWYGFVRMQRRVARRLPAIITVSEAAKGDLERELGVERDRVTVVPNGVDAERWRPVPDVARRPGRIVTTASADVPLKGLVHLLEAVAKLRTERDVDLVVVGRARGAAAVIDRLGIADDVRFVSGVTDEQLVELYAEAEVAVVPSLYEGFSLPALEAMACGVPLVATTGGALPEVVGDAGLLVPPGDAGALALAIEDVIDDPELRRRLGDAGRRRAAEWSWDRAASETVAVLERVAVRC